MGKVAPTLKALGTCGAFVALAALYLWPLTLQPHAVAYPPHSEFSDLLISHWPNAAYWRTAVWQLGQWPLWNAQQFAGQPFAADPLAGIWYPPNLLLLLLPLPFGFNVLLLGHLAWGGYGLYRWLRAQGLAVGAAALAGVAFTGTPKLIAHLGAGHVSLVFAVAWTPWWLWAIARGWSARKGAVAGAVFALLGLADLRWAFYAGGLGAAYALWHWASTAPRPAFSTLFNFSLAGALCAGALLAPQVLPLAEFLSLSRRSALTLADASTFSLPWVYLLGLLIPNLRGFHEYMTYVGVLPLLLAFAGLQKRTAFWALSALLAMAFALGTNFIVFPLLFGLVPGLSALRVPPRVWFVVALSVCVLAGYGVQALHEHWLPLYLQRAKRPMLSARALTTLLMIGLGLTVLDLVRVNSTLLEVRAAPGLTPAAQWLQAQPGLFRVYSPSYSLPPGDTLQHLEGVNPLQLAQPGKLIEQAIGVTATRYSVTVPAFEAADADLATMHIAAPLDPALLARLDVRYVAAEFDIPHPALRLVQTFGSTRIYENALWQTNRVLGTDPNAPAPMLSVWTPNRIEVQATGPTQLVFSEVVYPGWQAWLDGQPTTLETFDTVFRAVRVPAGSHTVVLEFQPPLVGLGGVLAIIALLGLVALWRWAK